jgi:hypothetical protein
MLHSFSKVECNILPVPLSNEHEKSVLSIGPQRKEKSMEILAPLAVGIAFFITIILIVKTVFDSRTKRQLIEKGVVDDKLRSLFEESPELRVLSVLKWAFVLIGVGLGILAGRLAPPELVREYMMAAMLIFTGVGLILYYIIARYTIRRK